MAESSRNEGYVAINRLTGAFLAESDDRRKLVGHVKAKGLRGTYVEIIYHARGGARTPVQRFRIGG